MKHLVAMSGLLALLAGPGIADSKKYSIADLKALIQQKSFSEALAHLDDIAPVDRNAEWQEVLGQAAIGTVADGADDISKLQNILVIEKQYPAVLKYSKYVALRTEVGPKGFDVCFQGSYDINACRDYALKFVDDDPSNGKLALTVAKIARRNMFAYGAVAFFKRAIAAKAPSVCKDSDLELAIVAGLGLPKDDASFGDARTIAGTCWADLKKPVLKELAGNEAGYYHDNVCDFLKTTNEHAKVCEDSK
jgi:hypothetical protein